MSMPRCSISLKRAVRGNGTLTSTNPEKKKLITPIMTIFGSMKVTLPFIMSTMPIGFIIGFAPLGTLARRMPVSFAVK